ncbi:MAG: FeoB-associated Cys-rich membrane protein [Planctomycetaceae bacterium]|jgi:hypothetical protein|nr:FeoB-associated Cys-rich membrane protein [Planctomycetaceae bacterium]
MFGIIVAVLALAAVGWYFWTMLKPFFRSSDDQPLCGHCSDCPASRQSLCRALHQIEISPEISSELTESTDKNSNRIDQTSGLT